MKYSLVSLLICPACQSGLELKVLAEDIIMQRPRIEKRRCSPCAFSVSASPEGQNCSLYATREIREGIFSCRCGEAYAILGGIPVLLSGNIHGLRLLQSKYGEDVVRRAHGGSDRVGGEGGIDVKPAQRFGYEWTRYPACFEAEERAVFFEETQLAARELRGRQYLMQAAACCAYLPDYTGVAGRADCARRSYASTLSRCVI